MSPLHLRLLPLHAFAVLLAGASLAHAGDGDDCFKTFGKGRGFPDCNNNGVPDFCDVLEGDSEDCNENLVPDECEPDQNGNGIPDDCEDLETNDLDCVEFDRYEELTPNDTLSLLTRFHNPESWKGYVWVVAVNEANEPVGFDHLIGNSLTIRGEDTIEYAVNPVDYRAAVAEGASTDVDADGILDLNGVEYEKTAGQIQIPRFFGQGAGRKSELLLIALSGGTRFDTTIDFLVYNDNEEVFSAEHTFTCWDHVPLIEISALFGNDFLAGSTNHDLGESLGGGTESGWMRIDGAVANSTAASIADPAFYAVQIERTGLDQAAADLPFETCLQSGHLLPRGLTGDNEEVGGASDEDCDMSLGRRQAGSLLLFPEYDNLTGSATILTVTNTNPTESIRLHFVYIGRYGS